MKPLSDTPYIFRLALAQKTHLINAEKRENKPRTKGTDLGAEDEKSTEEKTDTTPAADEQQEKTDTAPPEDRSPMRI